MRGWICFLLAAPALLGGSGPSPPTAGIIYDASSREILGGTAPEEKRTAALVTIAEEHDTIIFGTIDSVGSGNRSGPHFRRWDVVINVREVLQGKEIPGQQVTWHIHSPTQTFFMDDSPTDQGGRAILLALTREGDKISEARLVFMGNDFSPDDVELVRKAVRIRGRNQDR